MICEIINPSDPYTLETDDFMVAAIAIFALGRGQLGLRACDNDELSTPVLFGWDQWLDGRGILVDGSLETYLDAHLPEMAAVLASVLIGTATDREDVRTALAAMPKDKHAEWLAGRHHRNRSSLNNIGAAAHHLACRWRRRAEKMATEVR